MTSIEKQVEISTNDVTRHHETTLCLDTGTAADLLEATARWWRERESECLARNGAVPCLDHFNYTEDYQTGEKFLSVYWVP